MIAKMLEPSRSSLTLLLTIHKPHNNDLIHPPLLLVNRLYHDDRVESSWLSWCPIILGPLFLPVDPHFWTGCWYVEGKGKETISYYEVPHLLTYR